MHDYTNPFRKDGPLVKCTICTKPATHTVPTLGHPIPVCDAHEPKKEVDPDVRQV